MFDVLLFTAGLNTSLVPMYISEIAPLNLRGGLGTVNQLAVTVGLLTGQVLGVDYLLGTDDGWPYLLGIAVFPSILQLLLLPWCPESPRYLLITKGTHLFNLIETNLPIVIFELISVCTFKRVLCAKLEINTRSKKFNFINSSIRTRAPGQRGPEEAQEHSAHRGRHRRDESRGAGPAGRGPDHHVGAPPLALSPDAAHHCSCDATLAAVVWHQCRFLLLHQPVHHHRAERDLGQVRNHRYRDSDGAHDPRLHSTDGQKRPEDITSLWARGNVHFLNLHNNLLLS